MEAGEYYCPGFGVVVGGEEGLWDPFGVISRSSIEEEEDEEVYFNSDELIVDFGEENVEVGEERMGQSVDGNEGLGDWFDGEWNVDDIESGVVEGIDDILVGLQCDSYDFGY